MHDCDLLSLSLHRNKTLPKEQGKYSVELCVMAFRCLCNVCNIPVCRAYPAPCPDRPGLSPSLETSRSFKRKHESLHLYFNRCCKSRDFSRYADNPGRSGHG